MKSVNKIITVFASACFTLSSCDIDPVLTSSYPDDITWSNETNLQLYINGFYSLIGLVGFWCARGNSNPWPSD